MALFNNFPWTNFHELNLDWIVQQVKEIQASFPEGLVGIPKGGTGANNPADARANLGVYATEISMSALDDQVISEVLETLASQIETLDDNVKYKICRSVQDIGLIPGAPTISSVWTTMSAGEMLACPPDELASNECPETYGTLLMIRASGNSGCTLFFGANHQYRKNYVANYPTGEWEQLLSNSDIIPVAKGGTGATNAADARQNLGIDFSGTVLSVAGVGADSAGNVPLQLFNLEHTYTSVSELGLTSGSAAAVWAVLPINSWALFPSSEITDSPATGTIEMHKGPSSSSGFITFHGLTANDGEYHMYIPNGVPEGTWKGAHDMFRLITNTASASVAIPASGGINVIQSGGVTEPVVPEGFTELFHWASCIGASQVVSVGLQSYWIQNVTTATQTVTCRAHMLCVKNSLE